MFFKKRAFTLVELLISLTIFAVVALLCVNTLVQSLASARKIQAQVFLYTETQALMDQLAREIEQSTIDYEAYYLRYGTHDPEEGWETEGYGLYGQSFFDPGSGDPSPLAGPYIGIDGYKALCADGLSYYPEECPTETPRYDYLDLNTGAHPFTEIDDFSGYTDDETFMNAFCESADGSTDCNSWEQAIKEELILINGAGDRRTVFVHEAFGEDGEYRLSKIELTGSDTDNDGLADRWVCAEGYTCTGSGSEVPDASDLLIDEDPQTDFMPLTPREINIEEFYVILAPLEDPYRAFAEEGVQIQPQVTLVIKASLGREYNKNLFGDLPSITVQRTISTGVYSEVVSYE